MRDINKIKMEMAEQCNARLQKYATKDNCGNLKPCPDISKYVLRDKVKPCDFEKYGLKKDKCGNIAKCKTLAEMDIRNHPEYQKLIKDLKIEKDKCGNPVACKTGPNPSDITKHPQFQTLMQKMGLQKDPSSCDAGYKCKEQIIDKSKYIPKSECNKLKQNFNTLNKQYKNNLESRSDDDVLLCLEILKIINFMRHSKMKTIIQVQLIEQNHYQINLKISIQIDGI